MLDSGTRVLRPSHTFPSEWAHSCLFPVAPAAFLLSAAALNGLQEPRRWPWFLWFQPQLAPGPGAARTLAPAP